MAVPQPQPPSGPLAGLSQTLLPSVLRTFVPLCYALLVRWGLIEWLGLPDEAWTYLITTVVTTLFYVVLRVLERYWDKVGWLLGFAARPAVYVSGQVLSTAVVQNATGQTSVEVVTDKTENPRTEQGRASVDTILLAVIAGAVVLALLVGWDWIDFNANGR
jgi:hypothetical protein